MQGLSGVLRVTGSDRACGLVVGGGVWVLSGKHVPDSSLHFGIVIELLNDNIRDVFRGFVLRLVATHIP